jgi:glycosyltransferase involved in cell wall biosynthesis
MRILCLSYAYSPSVGGIESMSKTLTDEWSATGHEVKIVTNTPSAESDEANIFRKPSIGKLWKLYRWSDVCYMNNISLRYTVPFLLSRKTVITAAGLPNDVGEKSTIASRLKRFFYAKRRTIAISSYMSKALKGATTIIPNCYDDATFVATAPWPERTKEAVVVARLVSGKGVSIAIQAIRNLHDRGEPYYLTVIGSGQDEASLQKQCEDLGIQNFINFTGSLRGKMLRFAINEHKIFLVPSIYREPFGIVCLEGIACGCVVIGSNTGGIPDAIGPCGILFKMGDVNELADAISRALAFPENPFMAATGKHLAKHTSAAVAAAYVRVFEEIAPQQKSN